MRPLAIELDEEIGIEAELAARLRVQLDHPPADSAWIELDVPAGVQRVGQVDPAAVTTDLDHLRTPVDRAGCWMRSAANDPADVDRARLHGMRRVCHVVALQFT